MALKGELHLTLSDHIKRMTPAGSVERDIVEISEQMNPALKMIPFVEGNLTTGNRAVIRTDMPNVAWTAIGQPVLPGKSGTRQVDDTTAKAEALSHIPVDLAALNGNTAAFRLSEQIPFIEAMNQEIFTAMFYHNSALDPRKPLGLAPRYNTLATSNVWDGGDRTSSSVTSLWFIGASIRTYYGLFPKGQPGGLQHTAEANPLTLGDDTNGYVKVLQDWYEWNIGWQLKDWRYVMRYCNLATTGAANLVDPEVLNAMYRQIPSVGLVQGMWVCNRTIATQFDNMAMNKSNAFFTSENVFGEPMTMYRKMPIVVCDGILDTEDVVA